MIPPAGQLATSYSAPQLMTAMYAAHLDVEEENRDDNFEFTANGDAGVGAGGGSRTNSRRQRGQLTIHQKLSVGSRAETEDWDAETTLAPLTTQGHVCLATSTTTLKPPSRTPSHAILPPPKQETENWDNDFEDGLQSPQKVKPTSFSSALGPPPPSLSSSSPSAYPQHGSSLLHPHQPSSPSPSTPSRSPSHRRPSSSSSPSVSQARPHLNPPPSPGSPGWDNNDNDAEFGVGSREEDEEDRTVTARSRRAALSRSSSKQRNASASASASAATAPPPTAPPPTPQISLPFALDSASTSTSVTAMQVFLPQTPPYKAHTQTHPPPLSSVSQPQSA